MNDEKIRKFLKLAGQSAADSLSTGSAELRKLGAQLLLSEVLEYVVYGLGVTPVIDGHSITKPDDLHYETGEDAPDKLEMIDGLADVAYTMYWNSVAFGVPLEEAFELVCDNNLEKFVKLSNWNDGERELALEEWHCCCAVSWPKEVVQVSAVKVENDFYAVGRDERGKVRKPSTYQAVDLNDLIVECPPKKQVNQ